jgi:hypothetical protein
MNITHTFKTKSHNLISLFENVSTFTQFMRNLERQSDLDILRYDKLKYLGDGFEFFVELFLKLHQVDNRVGVYHYEPNLTNDNGVDGIGVNIRNEKCVVQIKYRSNVTETLTATKDHLSNLFTDGMITHNVVTDNTDPNNFRHFIFTTAKGLNFYTDNEMFKNKVRCFGYNEFKQMLDNNIVFWNEARRIIVETIKLDCTLEFYNELKNNLA